MAPFSSRWRAWRLAASGAAAVGLVLTAAPALAWQRHDLITRPVVQGEKWLAGFSSIVVEPATSDAGPYNPSYVPVYLDKLPGQRESAAQILDTYVDEPSWGMDEGLKISPWQPIDGDSQQYRRNYEYFLDGVVRVGSAPDRVARFYGLALAAMKAGQTYWAFRDLARALFYLEELGDPLNTRPFLYSWLWRTRFDRHKLGILVTNVQLGYDRFAQDNLTHELAIGNGPLLDGLRDPPAMAFDGPKTAALALSQYSNGGATKLLVNLQKFLPKRVLSTARIVLPLPSELLVPRSPSYYPIMQTTADDLRITAGAVKGVLELAHRDFARIRKARKSGR